MPTERQKKFNVTGPCVPGRHYMVNTAGKIDRVVHDYIEQGAYFTINRARQYGKTTMLSLLEKRLRGENIVIRLSFESRNSYFESFSVFTRGISSDFAELLKSQDGNLAAVWDKPVGDDLPDQYMRRRIAECCGISEKPVILMIDEVDKAANEQVFAAFLGLLRDMYIDRSTEGAPTFQSVILAGVHDIKNLKKRIRPDSEHAYNSPWNIAASFDIDMSFSSPEIAAMLEEYEGDRHTGMDVGAVADQIYYYTSGYPFLVSRLCKTMDETPLEWSPHGVDGAETRLLGEDNTLFDDLIKNINNHPDFGALLKGLLLGGADASFDRRAPEIQLGMMYGIIKDKNGKTAVANLIFEKVLYSYYTTIEEIRGLTSRYVGERSQYVVDGHLDAAAVVDRFSAFMRAEYRDEDGAFIEAHARLLFLSFLKPIINGTGHYAVEPETRGNRRMDVVVFYGQEEFIFELKIWHGEERENAGVEQLAGYLKSRGQKKGYLISFCDNKTAPREGRTVTCDGCEIKEVVIAYRDKA